MKINLNIFFKIIWFALFLVAFFSVVWYQFSGLKLHFFHEAAYPLLYSKTNIDTGTLFSSVFSGREISPISWPLVGSLLLLLGGKISLNTHSLYAFSYTLFVLFVSIAFCRVAKFSFFTSIFFLILIFTTFGSAPSRYNWLDQVWIWPMNSYGVYDFFSLICFICVLKTMRLNVLESKSNGPETSKNLSYWVILSAIIFFLFALNGTRGFLIVPASILTAIFMIGILKRNPFAKVNNKHWLIVLTLTFFACSGLIIIQHLTTGVYQPWQDPHKIATLNNFGEFRDRLASIPYTWLTLFDAIPQSGLSVFALENITHISNTFFAVLLFVTPFLRLRFIADDSITSNVPERVMTYRFLFVLAIVLIASIYGSSAYTPRYLLPLAYASLFVFPFYVDSWWKDKRYGVLALILILTAPAYIQSVKNLTRYSFVQYKESQFHKLANILESEGLSFGFAGPWHTDIITLNQYSGGKIELALIDPEDNKMQPHLHGDKRWFNQSYHQGLTFVALPSSISFTNEKNKIIRRKAIKTIFYENWVIDIYSENISDELDKRL